MAEFDLLTGALKVFSQFDGKSIDFTYDYSCKEYRQLIDQYHIDEVAGKGDTIDKVMNLMKWCSENVQHNNGTKDVEFLEKNSLCILDYCYKKGSESGVYCRLQAIVFTECCLALGIKSRILHCLPFTPYDFESHVVSMVFIDEMDKWILIDAGNGRFFLDENDNILSPLEARNRLGNQSFIKCNIPDENYIAYMAKNLFYFKSPRINTFGADLIKEQQTIYCAPKGLDVLEREVAYCEYAIRNVPPIFLDEWQNALNYHRSITDVFIADEECFFGR